MSKLKSMGALVVAVSLLGLAACGSGSSGGDGVVKGATISYVGFGGILDQQIEKTWMKPFTADTGAKFVLDSPTDYSKIQVQVDSQNVSYDIVDGDTYFIDPQCGKLFEHIKVDQSKVLPAFRTKSDCGVPDYVFGIGYYYDKEAFPNGGPQNCTDFFDTQKFPGKRAIWTYAANAGVLECAAIADGADPKNPYPIDLDKAFAKISTIKNDLITFDSGSQAVDAMLNQDAPIVMATTRNYVNAIGQGAKFAVAKEFAGRAAGAFAVPKGAPNKKAAVAFLESIMDPTVNRKIAVGAPPYESVMGGPVPASWPQAAKDVGVVSGGLADVAWSSDPGWWAENYDAVAKRYSALLAR